jgi:hypothetical protein
MLILRDWNFVSVMIGILRLRHILYHTDKSWRKPVPFFSIWSFWKLTFYTIFLWSQEVEPMGPKFTAEYIDTIADLTKLCDYLKKQSIFGVDLEVRKIHLFFSGQVVKCHCATCFCVVFVLTSFVTVDYVVCVFRYLWHFMALWIYKFM